MTRRRVSGLVALVVAGLSFGSLATAQEEPPEWTEARTIFDRGAAHYESGRYALAVDDFRRAHQLLDGHPRQFMSLYNLARAYEALGELDLAIPVLRDFVEAGGRESPVGEDAATLLADMERRVALRHERPDPVNYEPTSSEITSSPIPLEDPPSAGRGGGNDTLALILGIGGGVLLAGGAAMIGIAMADVQSVEDPPTGARWPDHQAAYERSESLSIAGFVLGSMGLGAIGVAIGLALSDSDDSAQVTARVGPGSLLLEGSW